MHSLNRLAFALATGWYGHVFLVTGRESKLFVCVCNFSAQLPSGAVSINLMGQPKVQSDVAF